MQPLLIAHRGASGNAPENTLAAFRLAWEEGADGIEGDFQLTADEEVVCIHDPTTGRVAKKKLTVATSRYADLAKLDLGSWKNTDFSGERIPRLGDVLDVLKPGKWLFIEIKSGVATVEAIHRILDEKQADVSRIVLICFESDVIRACREALPGCQAHWISTLKGVNRPSRAAAYAAQLDECGATGLQFDCRAPVGAAWLASLKRPVASWTVNDVAVARKLAGMGVNFLTTNVPGALRQALEADL